MPAKLALSGTSEYISSAPILFPVCDSIHLFHFIYLGVSPTLNLFGKINGLSWALAAAGTRKNLTNGIGRQIALQLKDCIQRLQDGRSLIMI